LIIALTLPGMRRDHERLSIDRGSAILVLRLKDPLRVLIEQFLARFQALLGLVGQGPLVEVQLSVAHDMTDLCST
jgi:hypothetical protein